MTAGDGIQLIESICEKIQRAESFDSEKPRRFGTLNLFANLFDVMNPFAHGHPKSIIISYNNNTYYVLCVVSTFTS
jgi:hypothetical protein